MKLVKLDFSHPYGPSYSSVTTMPRKISMIKLFKRKSIYEMNRFYAVYPSDLRRHPPIIGIIGIDDDMKSVDSFSTMATVDDNPGTGRVLDTHFFQPLGRRIERLAMRFTIRYIHPWQIAAFIFCEDLKHGSQVILSFKSSINGALESIGQYYDGSVIIPGLKSVIRQAR